MCLKKLKLLKNKIFEDKRVALIKLDGVIIDTQVMPVASKIIESIEQVKEEDFKTVVVRINSPGGTVGASQEIYAALKKLQEEDIKVVVSLGDVAASGGVYIAMGAQKIVSNPGTVTGSIGVIIKSNVLKDLYKKIGIDQDIVKSGKFKDILSEIKHLSREEKQIIQAMIDDTYNQFVNVVAEGRKIDIEKVKEFADGRIFTGSMAKELGLVDELGTQQDAVKLAAEMAGIKQEPKVVNISPKKSFWQTISKISLEQVIESGITSGMPLWLMPKL